MDSKTFLNGFNQAKAIRGDWESNLGDAYDLFLPMRDSFSGGQKGEKRATKLYNDVGVRSLEQFVNQVKNKMFPFQQKWAKLNTGVLVEHEYLNKVIDDAQKREIQIAYDGFTDLMFNYIWNSNLDLALLESLKDMAVSTGCILVKETDDANKPLDFVSIPAQQLLLNHKEVYREFNLKAKEINSTWSNLEQDAALNKIIDEKPDSEVKVLEGVSYNNDTLKWDYVVYTKAADKGIISHVEMDYNPFITFCWNRTGGETWGRGIAMQAQPTMSVLNRTSADILKNNAMAINPPAIVHPKAFLSNRVSLTPNSKIAISSEWNGSIQGQPISYLESRCNFNLGFSAIAQMEQSIREAFYLDQFGSADAPVRSATEISIRNSQMLEQQVSAFTRLNSELVQPLIKNIFIILKKRGLFQEVEFDEKLISIESTTTMSEIERMKQIEGVSQFMQSMVGMLGEQGIAVAGSTISLERTVNFLADKFGVPAELKLTQEEKEEQAADMQAQAAQQQGMQPQM